MGLPQGHDADRSAIIRFQFIPGEYAICRLESDTTLPDWAQHARGFCSVTRTADELSIVTGSAQMPDAVKADRGWSLCRIAGVLPFDAVGIMAEISGILAQAKISVLCVATYDTDYFLIRRECEPRARQALIEAGHTCE